MIFPDTNILFEPVLGSQLNTLKKEEKSAASQ